MRDRVTFVYEESQPPITNELRTVKIVQTHEEIQPEPNRGEVRVGWYESQQASCSGADDKLRSARNRRNVEKNSDRNHERRPNELLHAFHHCRRLSGELAPSPLLLLRLTAGAYQRTNCECGRRVNNQLAKVQSCIHVVPPSLFAVDKGNSSAHRPLILKGSASASSAGHYNCATDHWNVHRSYSIMFEINLKRKNT